LANHHPAATAKRGAVMAVRRQPWLYLRETVIIPLWSLSGRG
jgi:hypothetical protein